MEILSPASNMEHIEAAIDHKSDAVYGGLKKWNARNKAINFSRYEYNHLINALHQYGIKFYLTLNILMLDEEIKEVIEFLKENSLPDAFIVTDIGLINVLKKEFPIVPLHFSTQFGAHNIDDVNYVKSLGGERVILARELTLEEIKKIETNKKDIELECFVWGSQCLSFSGLCFLGTIINGGGGNRGKCIITCRDVYSVNGESGQYLYVPDMDVINYLDKLDGIDCFKLEGRRRNPKEIASILDNINNHIASKKSVGYLMGKTIKENNLHEKINSRTKPLMMAKDVRNITSNDICVEYQDSLPIKFSKEYDNSNVMYIYTEIKKKYDVNAKNLSLDFSFIDGNVKEVLYVNHKGSGNTFYNNINDEKRELNFSELVKDIETINPLINIYKIKYQKNNSDKYFISKKLYNEIVEYLINDCASKPVVVNYNEDFKINNLYLETMDEEVINKFIDDESIKIIYNISTVLKLRNIKNIIDKYNDKIIYKLPLFNWNSEDIIEHIKLLENKEVMFTRLSQIYISKDIRFKKKYIDYTVYVWNKESLKYLKEYQIDEFTASPELSYDINKKIFNDVNMQVIVGGKVPMVFTRNCFGHVFGCSKCGSFRKETKNIKNEDKGLDFEVICDDDYRMILNKEAILNDYSKVDITNNTSFRYVATGQKIDDIISTVKVLKEKNYYNKLKELELWKNSYECNLFESRD